MYEASLDAARLRQGDIIFDFYFPRYSFASSYFLTQLDDQQQFKYSDLAVVNASIRKAIILSQCCEFNEGKRNAFSLAAIFRVKELLPKSRYFSLAELLPLSRSSHRPKSGNEAKVIGQLLEANIVDLEKQNDAVNTYLLEPDGSILTEHHVVDLSQIVSVKIEEKNRVLKKKVLQLDQQHRREFQLKVAYFYGRKATLAPSA